MTPKQLRSHGPPHRIIKSQADIHDGIVHLSGTCRYMQRAHDLAGDPPLRRERGGFEGLAGIIVAQQLSTASANAIWTKMTVGLGSITPDAIQDSDDDRLRALGLSRPKIKTLRAASVAVLSDALPVSKFAEMDQGEIRAVMTAVSGIGPWTTDIYLMFCLGRADQFAPGDLALQIAAERLMKLKARPSPDQLAAIALKRWQPWRGVAARMLWHYYAWDKRQAK